MGAKYLPNVKDQKATQRFQTKQLGQSKFIKPVAAPSSPKKKKK